MTLNHNPLLTASEISSLWTTYVYDSMSRCGIRFFLGHVKDESIRSILGQASQAAETNIARFAEMMTNERYPVPVGFTDADVDMQAPPLFSEHLILKYIIHMSKFGIATYGLALTTSTRSDVAELFTDCLNRAVELHKVSMETGLEKGIYVRAPHLQPAEGNEYVHKESFMEGLLGDKRPLLGIEIGNLFYSLKRNAIGKALIIGFSQTARSDEIREYMIRGRDMSKKQTDVLSGFLTKENLPVPAEWDSEVTSSTVPPFSDKLMLFHITTLAASAIGQFGISLSASPRKDIALTYVRLSTEIADFARDGAAIMIKNGWMEKPPHTVDRNVLAGV